MAETTQVGEKRDWVKEFADSAHAAMEAEKPNNKFISFKSGMLSYNDTPAKDNEILCVIVASAFENGWYPNKYDPNKIVSPECWAINVVEDDMAPTDESGDPQSTSCAVCPKNQWKSAPDGGKGKACKNGRRLAIVLADQLAEPDILMARLPVTSIANWSKYVNTIGNVVHRPTWGVITKMKVVPDFKTQFKVTFQFMGLIDDELSLENVHSLNQQLLTEGSALLQGYSKNVDEEEFAPVPAKAKGKEKF